MDKWMLPSELSKMMRVISGWMMRKQFVSLLNGMSAFEASKRPINPEMHKWVQMPTVSSANAFEWWVLEPWRKLETRTWLRCAINEIVRFRPVLLRDKNVSSRGPTGKRNLLCLMHSIANRTSLGTHANRPDNTTRRMTLISRPIMAHSTGDFFIESMDYITEWMRFWKRRKRSGRCECE